ncbi:MAG TPA: hypothetical protein VHB79_39670 [Polyangiaceae bacterium]|nr:hypothetical protein [Polyangiaceae bacterium]
MKPARIHVVTLALGLHLACASLGLAARAEEQTAGAATVKASVPKEAERPPIRSRWDVSLYGFAELDFMHDSTQSYAESANATPIARRGTYAGDRAQVVATAKNSRLGFKVQAPEYAHLNASAIFELDFFGNQPLDTSQNDSSVFGTVRVRHAYFKLATPLVDVLAGQYHDLYGWGGSGFYPSSVAYLGLPGQIYHRNPQLRLSKTVGGSSLSVEMAVAAVRPVMRHSELPDFQAGARVALGGWQGAASQGAAQPQLVPLSIGISAVGRKFVIPQFIGVPRNSQTVYGWGAAVNVAVPIVPVTSLEDRGNALTLTAEYSRGTGIADLYTGTTAGAKFPELANPGRLQPPPVYPQDVDGGLVTFDADLRAKTYNFSGFVVGAQYYLPVARGRVWVSANYGQIALDNMLLLTPAASWGAVYEKARYFDANLFVEPTPATLVGASFQSTTQTYGDGAEPNNIRVQLSLLFFL